MRTSASSVKVLLEIPSSLSTKAKSVSFIDHILFSLSLSLSLSLSVHLFLFITDWRACDWHIR